MITETISFTVDTTDPTCPYSIKLIVNGEVQWSVDHLTGQQDVEFTFADEVEKEFVAELHISKKPKNFTKIDENNNIVKDSLVSVTNFKLSGIDITQPVYNQAEYIHSFNDESIPSSVHKFYGSAGCNGFIKFRFSAPSYLWLLEHM